MAEIYDDIYIEVTKEENDMIEAYAEEHEITVEDAIKKAMYEMIDDCVENYSITEEAAEW